MDSLIVKDQTDDQIDYYNLLVGEHAKFKNEKELAKGKYISDNYILTLESQMDQMRTDLEKERTTNMAKAKLEDLINQYQNRQPEPPAKLPEQDKSPTIDPKAIESLVDSKLQERETVRRQQQNQEMVKTKLIEQYGTDYSRHLSGTMSDLEMTEDMLNQMARTNPKALLKMLGVGENRPSDPFRNTLRNTNQPFSPQGPEKKTWAYWQKLKEENPKKYFSRETNVEMHKAALELGDAFEDGDFNRYRKDFRISY